MGRQVHRLQASTLAKDNSSSTSTLCNSHFVQQLAFRHLSRQTCGFRPLRLLACCIRASLQPSGFTVGRLLSLQATQPAARLVIQASFLWLAAFWSRIFPAVPCRIDSGSQPSGSKPSYLQPSGPPTPGPAAFEPRFHRAAAVGSRSFRLDFGPSGSRAAGLVACEGQ